MRLQPHDLRRAGSTVNAAPLITAQFRHCRSQCSEAPRRETSAARRSKVEGDRPWSAAITRSIDRLAKARALSSAAGGLSADGDRAFAGTEVRMLAALRGDGDDHAEGCRAHLPARLNVGRADELPPSGCHLRRAGMRSGRPASLCRRWSVRTASPMPERTVWRSGLGYSGSGADGERGQAQSCCVLTISLRHV